MRGEAPAAKHGGEQLYRMSCARDVVSRAIVAEMRQTGAPHVSKTDPSWPNHSQVLPRVHETCCDMA